MTVTQSRQEAKAQRGLGLIRADVRCNLLHLCFETDRTSWGPFLRKRIPKVTPESKSTPQSTWELLKRFVGASRSCWIDKPCASVPLLRGRLTGPAQRERVVLLLRTKQCVVIQVLWNPLTSRGSHPKERLARVRSTTVLYCRSVMPLL